MTKETFEDISTWQEINAQPAIWRKLLKTTGDEITACRDWIETQGFRDIIFVGAGTSAYIGDALAAEWDGRFHAVPSTSIVAAPHAFFKKFESPLIVQFGRSGNSSESIGVMNVLDAACPEACWLHITCNKDSALANRTPKGNGESKVIVLPEETHDSGFAMTSSYSTMLLCAAAIFKDEDIDNSLTTLSACAETLISQIAQTTTPRPSRLVVLGSGALKGVAQEMALKILELTAGKTVASAESTLGFRHGPKAVIDGDTHVIMLFHPDPYTRQYDEDLAKEIRAQYPDTPLTTIGHGCAIAFDGTSDSSLDAVLYVLFAQIRACQWSKDLGLNVDNPFEGQGNLSRVVSGVTLYEYEGK